MTAARKSKLELYSLGIVAKDKPIDSVIVEVYPVEEFPTINGDINKQTMKHEAKTVNSRGKSVNTQVEGNVVLKATWIINGNSNRASPPDVYQGETIQLYRYADEEELYWSQLFREPKIRRRERALYTFGATQKKGELLSKENSYWFEVDAIKKNVQFHTTKVDGEITEYDIKLDLQLGTLTIKDTNGNTINLNSKKNEIEFSTAQKDRIFLGGKIELTSPGPITANGNPIG